MAKIVVVLFLVCPFANFHSVAFAGNSTEACQWTLMNGGSRADNLSLGDLADLSRRMYRGQVVSPESLTKSQIEFFITELKSKNFRSEFASYLDQVPTDDWNGLFQNLYSIGRVPFRDVQLGLLMTVLHFEIGKRISSDSRTVKTFVSEMRKQVHAVAGGGSPEGQFGLLGARKLAEIVDLWMNYHDLPVGFRPRDYGLREKLGSAGIPINGWSQNVYLFEMSFDERQLEVAEAALTWFVNGLGLRKSK